MRLVRIGLKKYYLMIIALLAIVGYQSPATAAGVTSANIAIADVTKTGLLTNAGYYRRGHRYRYRHWPRYRYRYRRWPRYGRVYGYGRRCGYWRFRCRQNWYGYSDIRGCLRYHGC